MAPDDAKSQSLLTQSQRIRLELLSMAYRHDRSPDDVIDRARKMEGYVNELAPEAVEKSPRKRGKDREANADGPI